MKSSQLLLGKIRSIVKSYIRAGQDAMRQQWGAQSDIQGEAETHTETLQTAEDIIAIALIATGQRAWIAEFGKGSLMDDRGENPFLTDYINSPNFNPARKRALGTVLSVVGRPQGDYYDLDGNEYYSTGNLEGIELETWKGQPLFPPIRGKHIIKNIIDDIIPQMQNEIQEQISNFTLQLFKRFPRKITIYGGK